MNYLFTSLPFFYLLYLHLRALHVLEMLPFCLWYMLQRFPSSSVISLSGYLYLCIWLPPGWCSGKESTCQCRRLRFDPWVRGKATHSNILAWRIPWIEEPGGLQSTGCSVGHDWETEHTHISWAVLGLSCSTWVFSWGTQELLVAVCGI